VIKAYIDYYNRKQEDSLDLVTPGLSKAYINSILKSLDQTQVIHKIHTPGYIESEDLPLLYSCSALFLFPSLSEGFGLPVLEAMACGCPVVTSNISSLPEIACDAARLVNPFSIEDISSAIVELMDDVQLRKDLIAKGLRQVEKFHWSRVAERTMEIYEHVYALQH
jgi:glycosyltransferase involved in cell wall biosynthesis